MKSKEQEDRETIAAASLIAFQLAVVSQLVSATQLDANRLLALGSASVGLPVLSFYLLIVYAKDAYSGRQRFWLESLIYFIGVGASILSVAAVFLTFSKTCAILFGVSGFIGFVIWQLTEHWGSNEFFARYTKAQPVPQTPVEAQEFLVECAITTAVAKGLTHREWYSDQETIDYLREIHPETFSLFSDFAAAYSKWSLERISKYHRTGNAVFDTADDELNTLAAQRDRARQALIQHLSSPDAH